MPNVIAIDVGGTSIKAARADESGALHDLRTIPTPVAAGPDAVVAAIRGAARDLMLPDVAAAGVVVPGAVDSVSGVASYAANVGWRDVPLGGLLAAELGVPVFVDNDVRAAGLAEQRLGRARDVPDCLIVVIGTGIAAVVIARGAPVRGALGLAGEIGHLPVRPDGEPCACGQRGCTEVYASAAGIARRYQARAGVPRTAQEIAALLATDRDAAHVWTDATEALGLALASCALLLDPALVVLAGGLAGAGDALRDPVAGSVRARLAWRTAPAIEISPLGDRAGLHGAALLAWRAARGG